MYFRGLAVTLAVVANTNSAFAYLDPGAGSFALQMIAAGLLAAGASVKVYWARLKEFFGGLRRRVSNDG